MKSIAQIALSLLISLQTIGVNPVDVFQIGEFYEHYQFHQEEYGHDLITFINLHYGEQKAAHQQKHQDHEDLPFHQSSSSTLVFYINTSHFEVKPLSTSRSENTIHFIDLYSSLFVDEILQPPRI